MSMRAMNAIENPATPDCPYQLVGWFRINHYESRPDPPVRKYKEEYYTVESATTEPRLTYVLCRCRTRRQAQAIVDAIDRQQLNDYVLFHHHLYTCESAKFDPIFTTYEPELGDAKRAACLSLLKGFPIDDLGPNDLIANCLRDFALEWPRIKSQIKTGGQVEMKIFITEAR